jgi:PAS domain S-box-containing protein
MNAGLHLATAGDPGATVDFAHQAWKLVLHPRPAFYEQAQQYGSRLAFAAGMGMTLVIMLVLYRLQISRRNIERAESVANSARKALEVERQRLAEAQRIAHVGSWQLDVASQQVEWSDELYRMQGLTPGSPVPVFADSAKLVTAQSWEHLCAALTHALESGTPYQLELEMVKPDGSHGWMLARGEAVRDASGAIAAIRGTATDISERKLAADALRTSEENLAITLHSIGDAVIATDAGGLVTRMNPTAERLTGWALADAMGSPLAEVFRIVNATTREPVADPVQLVMAQGQVVGLANHTVLLTKGGEEYQIADSAAPIRNTTGAIVGVVLVFSDVTEKYRVETALQHSEQQYRNLLDNLSSGVVVHNPDTSILFSNPMAAVLLGLTQEQMLGKTAPDPAWCFLQDDGTPMPLMDYPVNRVFASRERLQNHVVGVRHPDRAQPTWVLCNAYPSLDEAGNILQVVVAFTDITQRKRAEQALIDSEERWKFAIEGAGDGLWDWNIQTGIAFYSPRYKAMYGYVDADFGTTSDEWSSRIHPEDAPGVFAALQPFMDGKPGPANVEFRMLCKDGSWKWTLGRGMVVSRNNDGSPLRMIGTNTDISERKQNEQILQQSLKDKQALLMEVHHRVKNNLQVISSLLRLETRRSTHAETKTVLTDMQGRIRSMAVLHESLYRSGTFASIDLGAYLKQLATQAFRAQQSSLNATVRLQLDVASLPVGMDQAIPCGLLVNELISNCLKHGFPPESSGEVKVQLQPVNPDNPQADALWRLCVSDNGVGLPTDFETKRQTSLGLQLVSDLSRQIGGTLAVQSQAGAGAEFSVVFKTLAPVVPVMPL